MANKGMTALIFLFFISLLTFLLIYSQRKLHVHHYKSIYEAHSSTAAEVKDAVHEMASVGTAAVPILTGLLEKENDPEKLRLIIGSLLMIHSDNALLATKSALSIMESKMSRSPYFRLFSRGRLAHPTKTSDEAWSRYYNTLKRMNKTLSENQNTDFTIPGPLSAHAALQWAGANFPVRLENNLANHPFVQLALLQHKASSKQDAQGTIAWNREQKQIIYTLLSHDSAALRFETWRLASNALRDITSYHPSSPSPESLIAIQQWTQMQ